MDQGEPIVMVKATVTCTKADCRNKDAAIKIDMAQGGKVVCGPCGSDITPV
jgi:hypothetical protein